MSLPELMSALELGIIYAVLALGSFISYRTLNFPDLTVEGSYTLGAAVSVMVTIGVDPYVSLFVAFFAGCIAGAMTALLSTKFKIQPLLAGILMMLALYSINLKVMGNRANVNMINERTIFQEHETIVFSLILLVGVVILLFLFLKTKYGFVLRATGDNPNMVRALGANTDLAIIIGLAISNGLVALSGALIAQEQLFADASMGIGMVVIGLASVIIGEGIFGKNNLLRRLIAVVLGAILYRVLIGFVISLGMPTTDLKLVSAIIVAMALAMPVMKEKYRLSKKKRARKISMNGKGGQV